MKRTRLPVSPTIDEQKARLDREKAHDDPYHPAAFVPLWGSDHESPAMRAWRGGGLCTCGHAWPLHKNDVCRVPNCPCLTFTVATEPPNA